MAVGLVLPSFVCATLLAAFIPVQRIRTSVPRLSIILWLFGYNLVHGINAIIWSGNVDIHVPVWCDIATNFMLGANIALPAAFFCVSRQLELISSTRTISIHATVIRNRLMLEIFMCYLLPILYVFLHLVVQDHRFDLVENFGCAASIDPSAVAFSLMWIPPLLICSMSIIFYALSIRNSLSYRSTHFPTHLESRSTMNSSSFYRCLVISMTTTIAIGLVYIFCSFSGPAFHPWSWSAMHASMSKVDIPSSQNKVNIKLAWWGSFVVSVLYLLLSLCLGEETRDIVKWVREQVTREGHFILPIHFSKNRPLSYPGLARPLTFEFKSGWDDMLDFKRSKFKKPDGKASSITTSACSNPTPSISTESTEDDAFKASTLTYLGSPTAKSLGLSGSPVLRTTFEIPPKPLTSPPPLPTIHVTRATDSPVPAPPVSPFPDLSASCYSPRSRPRSLISSSQETAGHPLYPTLTPPHPCSRPLDGSDASPQ